MNGNTENDGDIFNLEGIRPVTTASSSPTPKRTVKAPSIGPLHLSIAGAAIAAIWIAWPYVMKPSPTHSAIAPSATLTLAGASTNTTAPPREEATDPLAAIPSEPESNAPSIREVELRAQVATLRDALAAAQERLTNCAIPAVPVVPVAAPTSQTPTSKRVSKIAGPRVVAPLEPNEKLAGFSVNTVYSQQAWIAKSDRTYVVQRGDVVDGVRILSIDARTREVITDAGVIR